jgi:hypothetical protein
VSQCGWDASGGGAGWHAAEEGGAGAVGPGARAREAALDGRKKKKEEKKEGKKGRKGKKEKEKRKIGKRKIGKKKEKIGKGKEKRFRKLGKC